MSESKSIQPQWLDLVQEEIVDPERRIIDTHHHLWGVDGALPYCLDDLWADTGSGHRVEQTIFMECGAEYRSEGPDHLRSLGEVEFIAGEAEKSASSPEASSQIVALVSHIDLMLGDAIEELVHLHEDKSQGLFRGVRHAGASAKKEDGLMLTGRARPDLYSRKEFRDGIKRLGRLGHTYDTWHYHYQIQDFIGLARAVPDTQFVLDHFGTPLGVGPWADKREEVHAQWKKDIAELARCENVVAKLGGLAMPDNGFGWMGRETPPTSDEFVTAQRRYYLHTIDCFGPDRCMFESNFPVDKMSISYPVLWNGMKKIVQDLSEDEKDALFSGTATRIYRL
ncbi:MAG: amidohydrolase family protein [Myxococcales bacterium]|nr:amidohydrolase [Myxococcales bacterium]HIK83910.1 amidohydrolase [Myxococcales bacterium]